MDNLYEQYYKNASYTDSSIDFNGAYRELDWKIGKYITGSPDRLRILEVGSGQGAFAYFCKKKGVLQYIWLELDNVMAQYTAKIFPEYSIRNESVFDFFQKNTEKFDIIFMSHVLEHFSIEDWISLSNLIREHLNPGGIWINLMPNGASIAGTSLRYSDITHKIIYTLKSFNQVLSLAGFKSDKIVHSPVFPRLWLLASVIYFLVYYFPVLLLWRATGNIYSSELLTVSTK